MFPGNLVTGTMTRVISPSMVNETIVGFSLNHWGHRVGKGAENADELHAVVAAERRQPAHGQDGPLPAAPRSVWRIRRTRAEEHEQGRVAVPARAALHGRRPHEPPPDASLRLEQPAAEVEPQPAPHAAERPLADQGPAQLQVRLPDRARLARPSRVRPTTPASTTSATTRRTRSARATATPTPCSGSSRATPSATSASTVRTGTGTAGSTRRTAGV